MLNKCYRLGWCLLLSLFWSMLIVVQAHAEESDEYQITQFKQHVQLNRDGSADVNMQTNYHFDTSKKGVYVQQGLGHGVTLMGQPTVSVNGKPVAAYVKGSKEGLKVERISANQKGVRFKLYQPVRAGDRLTVEWHYRLANVAKRYQDVGEVNWRIIGGHWAVPFEKMQLEVDFPTKPMVQTKVWQHGLSQTKGHFNSSQGRWTYQTTDYPAEQPLEVHMMFPERVLSAQHQVGEKRRDKIEKKEQHLKNRLRYYQLAQQGLALLAILGLLMVGIYWYQTKKLARFNQDAVREYELPSNLAPAIVGEQLSAEWMTDETALSATWMDLIARHYLQLVDLTPMKKTKKKNFILVLKKPVDQCQNFEVLALKILFRQPLAVGIEVKSQDLKLKRSKDIKKYHKDMRRFRQYVRKMTQPTLLDFKHIQKLNTTTNIMYVFFGILAGLDFILLAAVPDANDKMQLYGYLTFSMIGMGVVLLWLRRKVKHWDYTSTGRPVALNWHRFANMLRTIGRMSEREMTEVVLWDRYMAYAIVLGEAETVLKAFEQTKSTTELTNQNISDATMLMLAYHYLGPVEIRNYTQTNISNGTSGSFGIGGTSGGFGGSSGGGAF